MNSRILLSVVTFFMISLCIHGNAQTNTEVNDFSTVVPRLSPLPVQVIGCRNIALDLGGIWKFNPAPSADFFKYNPLGWSDIQVPSEWVMQNFSVSKNTWAGYARTFTLPSEWNGKRVKLRCNAIYSDASVYVNGQQVGKHSGGFTPFELDITKFVQMNKENIIAISVLNETLADTLASGSQYACHQLGGITRKITLFALPEVNLSSVQVKTKFDKTYTNADLEVNLEVTKEGNASAANIEAQLSLTAPDGNLVALPTKVISLNKLKEGQNLQIKNPLKWDNEHPNLYTLAIKLLVDGKVVETVKQKVGFRQVEVRGNELFVNGLPVKLRGSNHHEVYPVTGRSVPEGIHLKDIQLFREGNVNLLRTCHYPPDEALMNAADSLGMFIECEAPFCWAPGDGYKELVCRQSAEMVVAFRNHPSILFWSLANESGWGKHFEASSELVRSLDPTRPQTFNWMDSNIQTSEEGFTDIANIHYPVHTGPAQARKYTKRPVYLGEDCHLNAYNRLELATDPGLRDTWGRYLREMWDDIDSTKGCLGQSIWSGVDDTFYMPNGDVNGYGTWGPIDGWRRPKPEYWGMKKGYSPIRILNSDSIKVLNKTMKLKVHNRQNFANISEMKINWTVGKQTGTTTASIVPGAKGVLSIKLTKAPNAGDKLALTFIDPRGFIADQFNLTIQGYDVKSKAKTSKVETNFTETSDTIAVTSGSSSWKISKKSGQLAFIDNIPVAGPQMMILSLNNAGETQMMGPEKEWAPFTEPCTKWECANVTVKQTKDTISIQIKGKYTEANGSYSLVFVNGHMHINYDFTVDKKVNPRQIGVVFSLPAAFEHFTWERKGYWDVYPDDHIARLKGTVAASEGFAATSVGPRKMPTHPWRLDNLPCGNNDFCSTKNNVLNASLTDKSGNGLMIDGQGKQHVRCWMAEKQVNVLIADYSNGGNERFLRGLASIDDRPLKEGDKISGTIRIESRK